MNILHNWQLNLYTLKLEKKQSSTCKVLYILDGRREGREGQVEDIILCDGNYGVGACGLEWVHNRKP